jgi:hypothetical protein
MAMTSPKTGELTFGTIKTGRPLSNRAFSKATPAIDASLRGCSSTVRS